MDIDRVRADRRRVLETTYIKARATDWHVISGDELCDELEFTPNYLGTLVRYLEGKDLMRATWEPDIPPDVQMTVDGIELVENDGATSDVASRQQVITIYGSVSGSSVHQAGRDAAPAPAPTAVQTTVSAVLSLVPGVGGVLQIVYADTMARRAARANDWAAGFVDGLTDQALSDLEDLIGHDERLQDMLLEGLDAAMRTRVKAKRRVLGTLLAESVSEQDEKEFDELELFHSALIDLRESEIQALMWLRDEWARYTQGEAAPAYKLMHEPNVVALVRHGLVEQMIARDNLDRMLYDGQTVVGPPSAMGHRLLDYLRDAVLGHGHERRIQA